MPFHVDPIPVKRRTIGPVILPSGPMTPIPQELAGDPGTQRPNFGRIDPGAQQAPEFNGKHATILRVLAGAGALGSLIAGPNSTFGAGAQGVGLGAARGLEGMYGRHEAEQAAYQDWMSDVLGENTGREIAEGREFYRAQQADRTRILQNQRADEIARNKAASPLEQARLRKAQADATTAEYDAANPKARTSSSRTNTKSPGQAVRDIDRSLPELQQAIDEARADLQTVDPEKNPLAYYGTKDRIDDLGEQLLAHEKERRGYMADMTEEDWNEYQGEQQAERTIGLWVDAFTQRYSLGTGMGPPLDQGAVALDVAAKIEQAVGAGELTGEQAMEILNRLGL
jgi:hypothetical protein